MSVEPGTSAAVPPPIPGEDAVPAALKYSAAALILVVGGMATYGLQHAAPIGALLFQTAGGLLVAALLLGAAWLYRRVSV